MNRRYLVLFTLVVMLASFQPAWAQGQGNGHGNSNAGGNGNSNGNSSGNGNSSENGNSGGNGNSSANGNSGGNGNSKENANENSNQQDGGGGTNAPGSASGEAAEAVTEQLSESAVLEAVQSGRAVSLTTILPDVRARTGGEIIDAELQQVGTFLLYAVTVLTPVGKVSTEYYYAGSGLHVER